MYRHAGLCHLVSWCLLAAPSTATPQDTGVGLATVLGTVCDAETGRPLPYAFVGLADQNRATSTDGSGRYALSRIPAGSHNVTIRYVGYASRTLHVFAPPSGELEISVSLLPEPIPLPTVQVRTTVPVRGIDLDRRTGFPDRGSTIGGVRNHPLLAEPDVLQALGGGEVALKPESPSGVHVRGAASDETAYLLDGIPVYSPYHAGGVFSAWNPDAISRLDLSSSAPQTAHPHFLSGAAAAVTRAPGAVLCAQGSVSTTHTRLTIDGPLGLAGAGYLVSVRTGYPGGLAPRREGSYLRGDTGDWLAKLEAPAWGGRLRILGYGNDNGISTAATAKIEGRPSPVRRRNDFEWYSQSLGAEWSRTYSATSVRVLGWGAAGSAGSIWAARISPLHMTAARHDVGFLASLDHGRPDRTTSLGIRVERIGTSYRIEPDSAKAPWGLGTRMSIASPFVQHARAIGDSKDVQIGASVAAFRGRPYWEPRTRLQWRISGGMRLSFTYARLHQFAQSLRNAESVVGNVFPVDLYMGAGAPGIPVARSDQGVMAAEYQPRPGVRILAQAYDRAFHQLLLVAPSDAEPFTTGAFTVGAGASRGASVDAAVSTARLGLVATYGFQRLRLHYGASSYVPDYGVRHSLEGGVLFFPSPTWSIRFGVASAWGRRTTPLSGGLEWEAPNLFDRGNEFGGSPRNGALLGGAALPLYLRADVGLRKTWRFDVRGHRASIAAFGTITNLLNRKNVLTYATDPVTGRPRPVEMRPLAPLVVGLDWRY